MSFYITETGQSTSLKLLQNNLLYKIYPPGKRCLSVRGWVHELVIPDPSKPNQNGLVVRFRLHSSNVVLY